MLVLTRKMDEQIIIGDNIKITLIRIRGNSVRLGIEAPRDVRVVRAELKATVVGTDAATESVASKAKIDLPTSEELGELDALAIVEQAFAHPESAEMISHGGARRSTFVSSTAVDGVATGSLRSQTSNRLQANSRKGTTGSKPGSTAQVFVGSATRRGDRVEVHPAPLSRFMNVQSASAS